MKPNIVNEMKFFKKRKKEREKCSLSVGMLQSNLLDEN